MKREFKIVYDSYDEDACSVALDDAYEALSHILADLRECCNDKLREAEELIEELEEELATAKREAAEAGKDKQT